MISHAITRKFLETGGLWSISRGLARHASDYKAYLSNCDLPRRNDLDGRGNLSEEALAEFTLFFLEICLDQVQFMEKLMEPHRFKRRIISWALEEIDIGLLPPQTLQILDIILRNGEIRRSEIPSILEISDRHARRISSVLLQKGILYSASKKSSFKLAFPATLASEWFPGLFPPLNLS